MKILLFLLFTSGSLFGQTSNELQKQVKFESYSHLDSINEYSADYPTKLIEGSGFITNQKNKKIGSTGFSIQITKDKNDKMIRILQSESTHYKKYDKNPQKSIISTTTIYFDQFQQPDLAKNVSETLISNSLVTTKTRLFNLKENNESTPGFKDIKELLEVVKKY